MAFLAGLSDLRLSKATELRVQRDSMHAATKVMKRARKEGVFTNLAGGWLTNAHAQAAGQLACG